MSRIKSYTVACIYCKKEFYPYSESKRKYCSIQCQQDLTKDNRIEEWLAGQKTAPKRKTLQYFLTKRDTYKCSVCSIKDWNGKNIVLEIDHIDGNSSNDLPENLRFICSNCHSQTSTFKGRNKGNGRWSRRQRFKKGKSW